jgi:2-oxoglutarate dehydrogenase E2 component (dihydrolipoamide succinyltransferase)
VTELVIPKLNNNDTAYDLVRWFYDEGEDVPDGAAVLLVETAKTAEEITAEKGGVLHRRRGEGTTCVPGEVVGHLFPDGAARAEFLVRANAVEADDRPGDFVITEPARELMAAHGVATSALNRLGKRVIRRGDVEHLLHEQPASAGRVEPLGRNQQAVADVVAASHRQVPAAYVAIKVDLAAVLRLRRESAGAGAVPYEMLDVVVAAVGRQLRDFPHCFASLRDDRTIVVPRTADVGVTVDVGNGLYVPVVRDSATKTPTQINVLVKEFRRKASNGTLTDGDLAGGHIAVSVVDYAEVVMSVPMVLPPQVAMLSIGGLQRELRLGPDGVVECPVMQLGLAYDHRVINGRYAVRFLKAVRTVLQQPHQLLGQEREESRGRKDGDVHHR